MTHKRTIRARTQPLPTALAQLINRGSFHGSWLPLRTSGADNVANAERALERVAVTGWITRGDYEPSPAQRFFGLGGFSGDRLQRLDEQHRSVLAYHWLTVTTRWLGPADVEAVMQALPIAVAPRSEPQQSTDAPTELVARVIDMSLRAVHESHSGAHTEAINTMRERDVLAQQFTLADVAAYGAWLRTRQP